MCFPVSLEVNELVIAAVTKMSVEPDPFGGIEE
jgi:hypothetical protein